MKSAFVVALLVSIQCSPVSGQGTTASTTTKPPQARPQKPKPAPSPVPTPKAESVTSPKKATAPKASPVKAPPTAVLRPTPLPPPRRIGNPPPGTFVERHVKRYRDAYHQQLATQHGRYHDGEFWNQRRHNFRPWARRGFMAFAWQFRPMPEFYTHFSNPVVAWFYLDYEAEFYRPFYGPHLRRYPDLGRGYNHVGIFFPTEDFMTLNLSLSRFSIEAQVNYRRAMRDLSERLTERLRAPLNRHEVMVNQVQMLGEQRAVVIEGFVDKGETQYPFKALIDLRNSEASLLFTLATWRPDQEPTPDDLEILEELNDQIIEFDGQVEGEPAPALK